jgi:hypothetical protein
VRSLLERVLSRKFLMAASSVVALIVAKQYAEAAGVVAAYLAAEGVIDLVDIKAKKAKVDEIVDKAQDVVDDVLDAAEAA